MNESMFNLQFAIVGMVAVFAVITILTIVMVTTGLFFARHGAKAPRRKRTAGSPAGKDEVPEEHVAVIAAALAIHTEGSGRDVVLLEGTGGGAWTSMARERPGTGEVPALRRTR